MSVLHLCSISEFSKPRLPQLHRVIIKNYFAKTTCCAKDTSVDLLNVDAGCCSNINTAISIRHSAYIPNVSRQGRAILIMTFCSTAEKKVSIFGNRIQVVRARTYHTQYSYQHSALILWEVFFSSVKPRATLLYRNELFISRPWQLKWVPGKTCSSLCPLFPSLDSVHGIKLSLFQER